MTQNKCQVCGLENAQYKDHNNPWACITALKHKIFELQKEIKNLKSDNVMLTEQRKESESDKTHYS